MHRFNFLYGFFIAHRTEDDGNMDVNEKRKYPRFNVRFLAAIHFKEETFYASVTNISKKGIGIILTRMLSVDEIVGLKISPQVGGEEKAEISIKAKVVWVNSYGTNRVFRVGLEIVEISRKDVENFKRAIQYLKNYENAVE